MRDHKDFVAEAAIGSVSSEWKQMARLALKIRNGNCSPRWAYEKEKLFTGIFKRLLTDPIEEVEKEAGERIVC